MWAFGPQFWNFRENVLSSSPKEHKKGAKHVLWCHWLDHLQLKPLVDQRLRKRKHFFIHTYLGIHGIYMCVCVCLCTRQAYNLNITCLFPYRHPEELGIQESLIRKHRNVCRKRGTQMVKGMWLRSERRAVGVVMLWVDKWVAPLGVVRMPPAANAALLAPFPFIC